MAEIIRDSGDSKRRMFRVCHECGAKLEVTYLIPKRTYACDECGLPFIHHPALGAHQVEAGTPRSKLMRILPVVLFCMAFPYLAALAFGITLKDLHLAMVVGTAGILATIAVIWVRSLSKDPSGAVSAALVISGFATVALMIMREVAKDAGDQTPIETRLTYTAIALIGIGAFSFARFIRNRSALVRVSADGKV